MENTKQGKKPAEWFAQLKEPYRSEAIENIKNNNDYESLYVALFNSFTWADSPQGDKQWVKIHNSIEKGETTYLEAKNVSLINEVNNSQLTEQQNQIESEKVETDWKAKFEELQKDYDNLNFTYQNLMKIHEEQDLAYDALSDKYSKIEAYNDELKEKLNQSEKDYSAVHQQSVDLLVKLSEQNNQEKVYFFTTHSGDLRSSSDIETAKIKSGEDYRIYEAIKIGVKKSVLVNE